MVDIGISGKLVSTYQDPNNPDTYGPLVEQGDVAGLTEALAEAAAASGLDTYLLPTRTSASIAPGAITQLTWSLAEIRAAHAGFVAPEGDFLLTASLATHTTFSVQHVHWNAASDQLEIIIRHDAGGNNATYTGTVALTVLRGAVVPGARDIPDNSIVPDKVDTRTAELKRRWREVFEAAHIGTGTALPALAEVNAGAHVEIFTQAADGLSFVDIADPSTEVTSARAGDIIMALTLRAKTWVRVGNILGSGTVIEEAAGNPVVASLANLDKLLLRAGRLYRNDPIHYADPDATYRDFATADLPNGFSWGGVVEINPTASTVPDNRVIYTTAAGQFERKITAGGQSFWVVYDLPNWRGLAADQSDADQKVRAVGDVVFFGGKVQVAETYTPRAPDRFQWAPIMALWADPASADRIPRSKLPEGLQDALTTAQLVDLLQFDVVPGVVIGYSLTGQATDWLTDWRVWVSGGDTVGDVWFDMQLEGLATLAAPPPGTPGASLHRHKLSATNIYNFTFSNNNRQSLLDGRTLRRQGRDIEVDLRFYDAASGGNTLDIKTIAVDWVAALGGLDQAAVDARVKAVAGPVIIISDIASYDATANRFEDSDGDEVVVPDGAIVTLTQAVYDAAVADSGFSPNANAIFLTR